MFTRGFRTSLGERFLGAKVTAVLGAAIAAVAMTSSTPALGEPASCLSGNPADWPASSKPYFLVAFDTSGSMTSTVTSNNSCGYPNDRLGHGRCAMKNTFQAFAGQVNFGLMTYAKQ